MAARLIHVFVAASGSRMSSIAGQHEFPKVQHWLHGGLPHRSSEGALTVQQAAAWRLHDKGTSGILLLFDGRNAFAPSCAQGLRATCVEWFGEDCTFVKDLYDLSEIVIHTLDGEAKL